MWRRGIVTEVDIDECRARVRFPDKGDVESYWLEVVQSNTHQNQDYKLPDEGELVVVLLDERGESGVIIGAFYTTANKPTAPSPDVRRVRFSDGVSVGYNRATSTLSIEGATKVEVTGTPMIELHGETKIAGGAAAVARADKVSAALSALKSAISAAAVNPGDGGATLKTNIIAALAAWPPSLDAEALTSD